jgi:hypothetical protein
MDYITRHAFRLALGGVVLLIGLGTVVYHFTEHWSWLDAYYFSVVTLATVGYGDLVPHTAFAKLFTTIYSRCDYEFFWAAGPSPGRPDAGTARGAAITRAAIQRVWVMV